jgi:two-component system chemotaxis response regulator CheB
VAIKVLRGNPEKPIEFTLKNDEGLLLLAFNDKPGMCFHLIDTMESEHEKLLPYFKDMISFKFIGPKNLYKQFENSFEAYKELQERYVEIDTDMVVSYQASGKKLSFKPVRNEHGGKKKVMIIDDSKTIQKMISTIVSSSDKMHVQHIAGCPSEAKAFLEEAKKAHDLPDLITLDIHMPEMTGVEFLKTYLKHFGIPVIMISSISMEEGPLVLEALAHGAQTYIQKPTFTDLKKDMATLREKIEAISVTQSTKVVLKNTQGQLRKSFQSYDGLVAIGSSTGGTQALQFLFERFPNQIPPIVVTQHIPAVFSKALADRLNGLCPFTVKEAEDGEFLQKDTIYIAPGGKQFKVHKRGKELRTEINDDDPVNRFKPSVDYLFNSLAKCNVENTVGIILTGMGRDGAKGLLELKKMGAYTIAQDQESSVVFGMPKAAIEIDAHMEIASLDDMADKIVEAFNKGAYKAQKHAS